jgi:hypothetical protein
MSRQQPELKHNLGMFIGICQALASVAEVWYRQPGTVGHRYFRGHACIGWCLLLVVAAFSYSPALMQFAVATGAWHVMHKFAYAVRQRKGHPRPHSRFIGVSLLSFMRGNIAAYRVGEPLLTFIIGLVLIENGKGFGGFIVVLGVSLFFSAMYTAMANKAQVDAINDARAEQEWLAEATRKE